MSENKREDSGTTGLCTALLYEHTKLKLCLHTTHKSIYPDPQPQYQLMLPHSKREVVHR